MNGKSSFWTVRHAGGWAVKQQGSRNVISVHERQQDAWGEARRRTGGTKDQPRFTPPVRGGISSTVPSWDRRAAAAQRGPMRRTAA
jgi:hypothetical protein